jgi:3-phenylpropionate/cinnamic acid dioxygenase small subunit
VRELRLEIEEFHTEYCNMLDAGQLDRWVDYFAEDALYRITARENADAGLRVGLVYAEGRGMIRDRAFAILHTQMFAPRSMQHFTSNVRVIAVEGSGGGMQVKAQSNYLLLQTLVDGPTTIHQSGRYFDTFVREGARADGRLLIRERQCVYDTVLIANDLVYPV